MNHEAKSVIKAMELVKPGVYADKEVEIQDLFDNGIYNGDWDVVSDFEDNTPNIRLIQEDEFDQHRDDDMPEWDDMIGEGSSVYIFMA